MKHSTRLVVGLLLALACLLIAFRGIDFKTLGEALAGADYLWIIPAMAFVLIAMVFRAFRWRCLLSTSKKIGLADLFSAINICFMANNFLPARSGEFIRAVLIGRKHKVSISTVLATVVLERIFDAMCVIGLFLFLILSFDIERHWKKAGIALVVLYGALLAILVIARVKSQGVQRIVRRLLSRFSGSIAHRICGAIDSFLQGLNILREWKQVALIIFHSALVWASILLTYYFICEAFGIRMAIQGYIFLVCMLAIAVMAPIPGYIGSFHAAYRAALNVFGYTGSIALGCAIVAHGAQYVFIAILGIVSLWREGISFGGLREEEAKVEKAVESPVSEEMGCSAGDGKGDNTKQ